MSTHISGQGRADIRNYNPDRRRALVMAIWQAMLENRREPDGSVFLPVGEVLDAMAMIAGVLIASGPQAQVPSQLRELVADHGKTIVRRTNEALLTPNDLFTVMPEPGAVQ